MSDRGIVWFRSDLRIHDNEAIFEAANHANDLLYVYVFDERAFLGRTKFGFRKTNKFRAKFLIESVHNLRENLNKKGANLIVRIGRPESILFDLCSRSKSSWVFCNRERTEEEVNVQDALERNLWSIGREVRFSRGKMLYYTADLPFPITHTPDTFTGFRKEVEKFVKVRKPIPTASMAIPSSTFKVDEGEIPTLSDFGFKKEEINFEPRFKGGETAALNELNYYLWQSNRISHYKETRNGLLGRNYSSKLSPYLAHGCLSPKVIAHELQKYEKEVVKNTSTYWLFFELMWRDFFRLIGKKHGNAIFQIGGIQKNVNVSKNNDPELLACWIKGETGIPFIDANMREIASTGFMSNRGRQNTASFLIHDLNLNWIMGAEYFESMLVDYDPCSNYGNWNYIAGVGCDPRSNRYFNILFQARRYDPDGKFVRHWIPELKNIPDSQIHNPSALKIRELAEYGISEDSPYADSLVDTEKWN